MNLARITLLPLLGSLLLMLASVECTPNCEDAANCPCIRDQDCAFPGPSECTQYFCVESSCQPGLSAQGRVCSGGLGFCNGAGQCLDAIALGEPCSSATMCLSGFCEDGVCCTSTCNGFCITCAAPGSAGECASVPAGTNPSGQCFGAGVCDGMNDCVSGEASHSFGHQFGPPFQGRMYALASSETGNTVMVGEFAKQLLTSTTIINSPSDNDGFVVQVGNPQGPAIRYSDVNAAATGVAMWNDNGFVVTGWYAGQIELGGTVTTNDGSVEGFFAGYQLGGTLLGSRTIPGVVADPACPPQVARGLNGELVMMFRFSGSFDWAGQQQLSGSGDALFIGRTMGVDELDATHVYPIDGPARCRLASDANGETVVAGAYEGSIDFPGGTIVSTGGSDGWLLRIDQTTQQVLVQTYASPLSAEVSDVARTPADGGVVITGGFSNQITIGGTQLTSDDGSATFIAKLDPQGQLMWRKSFGDYNPGIAAIAVDSKGHIVHSGMFSNTIDLGGGLRRDGNAYLTKYTAAGDYLYDRIFVGEADNRIDHLTIGSGDRIILSGVFSQTLSLGDDSVFGNERGIAVIIRQP